RPQDLLFATSGRGRVGRHLLRPVRTLDDARLSTLLPYAVAGAGHHPLLARPIGARPGLTYADVVAAPATAMPAVEVLVGTDGRLRATVEPGDPVPPAEAEDLAFHPWHTGDDLRPVGLLTRLRRPAYGASQRARGAA